MKTILVPTDFSPSADNAVNYAAQLALTIEADLYLVHVYQIPISMNDVPVMMVSVEELRDSAERGLEKAKELLKKNFPDLSVKTEGRLGDIVDEVKEVSKNINPFAIVVGKHGMSGVERLLFGSTTLSIIRHSKVPVISVPVSLTTFRLQHLALAVDNAGLSSQKEKIKSFLEVIKTQLHLVHVQESEKESSGIKSFLSELNPSYDTIRNEEFVHGIESYVRTHQIDMLMILPHKHGLMERIFFKTHTAEIILKIRIPIVCIPET